MLTHLLGRWDNHLKVTKELVLASGTLLALVHIQLNYGLTIDARDERGLLLCRDGRISRND